MISQDAAEAKAVEPEAKHVCTHCGAQHASRSALFRHLRAQCDPTLNKENTTKLAVVVAYAGDAQLGDDVRNGGPAATTQLVVKAVASACAGAGAVVQSTHVAVSTEKHAGARANIVIVALRNIQAGARLTAATLDERLPEGLCVLAARFLTNSAADQALAGRLTKRIRRCAHVIAVPYAAVVVDEDERDDGRSVFVVATRPGGRDPAVDEAWVRDVARIADAPLPDAVEGVCGGDAFAKLSYGDAHHAASAVSKLDGLARGDVVLQAMPWREARAKLDARKRLKDALAAASRAVFSGAASVLRPASLARDVRNASGDWRDDWLLVRVRGFAQCPNQISAHG